MKEYSASNLNKVIRGSKRATYNVDQINAILDAGFIGHLSYMYEEVPISLPMAYGRIENKIYIHGSLKNRMLTHLLQQEKTSMTVMHLDGLVLARSGFHHSVNYRSVTLFGTMKEVNDPKEKEEALQCIVDHMIEGRWDSLRPINEKELHSTLVIEITIETASAKVRDVGVNDEKDDMDYPVWAGIIPIKQIAESPVRDAFLSEAIETPEHVLNYYETHKS